MSSLSQALSVPVSVGGKYHLVPITYFDGDPTEFQMDVNGFLKVNITTIGAKGQATMANSLPVTIASDQSNLKTNLYDGAGSAVNKGQGLMAASLPITIASDQSDLNIRLKDGAGSAVNKGQTNMAGSLPVAISSDQSNLKANLYDGAGVAIPLGQGLMAASLPVALASNQSAIPAKLQDGAGSAVNKGQSNMAGSLPVTLASDQTVIPVSQSGNWSTRLNDGAGTSVTVGQKVMASSLPVALASDQPNVPVAIAAGANTIGKVDLNYLSVIDQIDTAPGPVLDASVTTINNNVGAFVVAVTSLAAAAKKIRVADTTGAFIGVYTGAAASEVLAFIINPGMSNEIEHSIPIATRITLRSMDANAIVTGLLAMQFLG